MPTYIDMKINLSMKKSIYIWLIPFSSLDVYVDYVNGVDTSTCKQAAPCRSLQKAVEATPNDSFIVISGKYHLEETIVINKSLKICGVSGASIVPMYNSTVNAAFQIPNVSIELSFLSLRVEISLLLDISINFIVQLTSPFSIVTSKEMLWSSLCPLVVC